MTALWSTWSGPADADVVAFVHGAPDTSRSFAPVVERLSGVRALTYDRRGWGRSVDVTPPAVSLDDHVDDLLALLDGRPATIVGHSFGCCVALLASIRRPAAVSALGLWEPPFPWEDWWPEAARRVVAEIVEEPDPEAVGERLVRRVLGDEAWEALSDAGRRRRRAEGRAFVEEAREQLVPQFHLGDVTVPCVVAVGSETWPYMLDATQFVASSLAAPLLRVPGAGHFGHVTHPEGFAELAASAVRAGRRPAA
jgi:pimeloyl-ACP methyl ester carboxylesterase